MRAYCSVIAIAILSVINLFAQAQQAGSTSPSPPLSVSDIEHGLKAGVTNTRMAALVKQYGVDFELTEAIEQDLRASGANSDFLLVIGRNRKTTAARQSPPDLAPQRPVETADSAVAKAEADAGAGRIRDAVIEAQEVLKRDPSNLGAHRLLGRIYLRSLGDGPGMDGVLKLTIEQYEQLVVLEPANVDDHILLGRLYRLNNNLQKAEVELKIAVKLKPDSEEAVTTLALLYGDEGDTSRALQVLSSVPETKRSAKLYATLGAIYQQRKDYKMAIDAYKYTIQLDRNNLEAMRGLAENLLNNGQTNAALDAIKNIHALLRGDAKDREVYVTLSQMYTRLHSFAEAEQSLDEAERLSSTPDEKDYIWFLRGAMFEREKRYPEAEEQFKRVLSNNSDQASALNDLGYMLANQNMKLEEALGYIKHAVELDPTNGFFLDSLGWAYFRLGKFGLAEENLLKASQKINADPGVHGHLGDLYQKTGRPQLAVTNWELAIDEWKRTVAADVDTDELARLQVELQSAKLNLAPPGMNQKGTPVSETSDQSVGDAGNAPSQSGDVRVQGTSVNPPGAYQGSADSDSAASNAAKIGGNSQNASATINDATSGGGGADAHDCARRRVTPGEPWPVVALENTCSKAVSVYFCWLVDDLPGDEWGCGQAQIAAGRTTTHGEMHDWKMDCVEGHYPGVVSPDPSCSHYKMVWNAVYQDSHQTPARPNVPQRSTPQTAR